MANSLRPVTVAPKGMGLNDFVAHQEGFFAAEGLDVELDWKTFRGTQSSWKGLDYFQRPQDRPYTQDKHDVIQGACVWGSICNASAGMGKFVPDAYGVSPWAIFVRPDSSIRRAGGSQGCADLGRHARRQPFQRAVPAGEISAAREHQDGEHRRLRRPAQGAARRRGRGREPAAAADRHGRAARPAQDHRGHVQDAVVGAGELRARDRARLSARARPRREGDGCRLAKYLPLWKLAVPAEFESYHPWDFSKFGRGERFFYKTLPREEFDETLAQVKRWGLDQFLKDRSYEKSELLGRAVATKRGGQR